MENVTDQMNTISSEIRDTLNNRLEAIGNKIAEALTSIKYSQTQKPTTNSNNKTNKRHRASKN